MTDNEIYYSSFVYLLYNITPNLRFIFMDIDRAKGIIDFKFIYETLPSEIERELSEDITSNIITNVWDQFTDKREHIVSQKAVENIPKSAFILYARYEG